MIALTEPTDCSYECEAGAGTGDVNYYRVHHSNGWREKISSDQVPEGRIIIRRQVTYGTTGTIKISEPSGHLSHIPKNRHERRAEAAIRKRLRKLAR